MKKQISLKSIQDVLGLIGNDTTFKSVTFTKRTNGESRKLNGLCRVRKHLSGGSLAFDKQDKNLLGFWIPKVNRRENQKNNGYRLIPVEGINELRAHGRRWAVKDGIATQVK